MLITWKIPKRIKSEFVVFISHRIFQRKWPSRIYMCETIVDHSFQIQNYTVAALLWVTIVLPLQWRHDGCDGV